MGAGPVYLTTLNAMGSQRVDFMVHFMVHEFVATVVKARTQSSRQRKADDQAAYRRGSHGIRHPGLQ